MHAQSQSGALAEIMPYGAGRDRRGCVSPAAPLHRLVTDAASDETLVARVAEGDHRAIALLLARHQQTVYRFVLRDIVSEVFIELWRQAARFESRARLSTWLGWVERKRNPSRAVPIE
jgi:hypothetical protein